MPSLHVEDVGHGMEARAAVESAAFVGITEHYALSICLMRAQLSDSMPSACGCDHAERQRTGPAQAELGKLGAGAAEAALDFFCEVERLAGGGLAPASARRLLRLQSPQPRKRCPAKPLAEPRSTDVSGLSLGHDLGFLRK